MSKYEAARINPMGTGKPSKVMQFDTYRDAEIWCEQQNATRKQGEPYWKVRSK